MPVSNGSRFLDNMIQTRCDFRNGFFERFNLKQPAKNMTVATEKRVDAVFLSAFFVSFFDFLELFVQIHGGIRHMTAGYQVIWTRWKNSQKRA